MNDVLLGARLAFAGGRDGWARTALTAVGIGIGVAMLLLAASVPGALAARNDRGAARDDMRIGVDQPAGSDRTLLVGVADTTYREEPIRGRILRPDGPHAPVPPGVRALPRPGELVVSPALAQLLDSPEGALLRPRLAGTRVGTIADEGLSGPRELAFYAGSDTLALNAGGPVYRIDAFGGGSPGEPLRPVLSLLVAIIFVVLLLPIAVFLAAAVRFGGERRDRRLAALRLVGADAAMTRRIAAGEAAVGALLGIVAGAVFFAAGRQLVPLVNLWDISVYAADVRPNPVLAAVIAVTVPAVAVVVAVLALRRAVVEPLGVVRNAQTARRRLWWRLLIPAAGAALLLPLGGGPDTYRSAAGALLALIGAAALVPWLVESTVRRMRGGSVPWLLAVRRLQLDAGTSARLVNGIVVAVAGTIGLQTLFAAVGASATSATGQDPTRADVRVYVPALTGTAAADTLRELPAIPGVRSATGIVLTAGTLPHRRPDPVPTDPVRPDDVRVLVGDCAALAEMASLGTCADGDVFLPDTAVPGSGLEVVEPGTTLTLTGGGPKWTVPAAARSVPQRADPSGLPANGILATTGALPTAQVRSGSAEAFVTLDPAQPDAVERVRNAAAARHPLAAVGRLRGTAQDTKFVNIRRGLYLGVVVTLLLIAASMLVGLLEQLRERRRLLAMLAAVGTTRGTLSRSVMWQAVLPVALGTALAVVFGLGLGAVLLRVVKLPLIVHWDVVAGSAALGAAVVLLVTALSLPALWRLVRPENLRTE